MLQRLFSPSVQHPLDLMGIFVFAISGALPAVRKPFDLFGIVVLAEVTALGGGLFRDLICGGTLVALCIHYDALSPLTGALAVVTVLVLRLFPMRFHWRAPPAWNRRSTVREE